MGEGLIAFLGKDVDYVTSVAADNVLEIVEGRPDFAMTDEIFHAFADCKLLFLFYEVTDSMIVIHEKTNEEGI